MESPGELFIRYSVAWQLEFAPRSCHVPIVMCPILLKLELAIRSGEAEGRYRHFVRKTYLEGTDSPEDDAYLAFADQAVADAELRATEAWFALNKHIALCRLCAMANSN